MSKQVCMCMCACMCMQRIIIILYHSMWHRVYVVCRPNHPVYTLVQNMYNFYTQRRRKIFHLRVPH